MLVRSKDISIVVIIVLVATTVIVEFTLSISGPGFLIRLNRQVVQASDPP